ncbi:MAG: sodium-dependent transporter [Verrucomicrobiota bacterium]|nr:sodium-dependent transporter [Verrucomicrobiota bacterium]
MARSSSQAEAPRERWGSKLGVVLAVAGSAVGLGNFLRFPGTAVNNGGGAFMLPYLISFLILGIPICWAEWTLGRLGGRLNRNSPPGIYGAIWPSRMGPALGSLGLVIPVIIFMYYVFLEAWCLQYAIEFFSGSFSEVFREATAQTAAGQETVDAVVASAGAHFESICGLSADGSVFPSVVDGAGLTVPMMFYLVIICYAVNFLLISRGVSKGIEFFCKIAMPALIVCALIILVRVLTLDGIERGLGFMWNPHWESLKNPDVWVAAAGQIFFSLSIGFGLILTYASYLDEREDVVLSGLTAASMNEFCEVILGGMIVVPAAFLFLGASNATGGTFGLGFITVPSIMHFMPGGQLFGGLWFGLLWLGAVTSSLSMLQPAIAFLENGYGMSRKRSVAVLCTICLCGSLPIIWFSRNVLALDHADFWAGTFLIYLAATGQVIVFGWVIGAEKGFAETNRGGDFAVPRFFPFLIRYVTPTFLIVIFGAWLYQSAPDYLRRMSPLHSGLHAVRTQQVDTALGGLVEALGPKAAAELQPEIELLREDALPRFWMVLDQQDWEQRLKGRLGEIARTRSVDFDTALLWDGAFRDSVADDRVQAEEDAAIGLGVFLSIMGFLLLVMGLSVFAYGRKGSRNRDEARTTVVGFS